MTWNKSYACAGFALLLAAPSGADMFKPSQKDQIKLGQRAAADIRKKEKVLPSDDPRVRRIREIGARIIEGFPGSEKDPWSYTFDIIDKKDMNAFALPGGPMFFYTGLLEKLKTEDELAGIIGHELTHVRKEHWANAYADQQKRGLGLSVLLLIFKANRTVTDIASISNDLLITLPFSRRHETEADDKGFEAMERAGYNPQGLADVFRLLRDSAKGGKPPEFLSTHPDDKNRISRIEEKVRKSGRSYPEQRSMRWG